MKKIVFVLLQLFIFSTLTNCFVNLLPENFGKRELTERVIYGSDEDKILIISIDGIISDDKSENFFGIEKESMVASVSQQLNMAYHDNNIKGVILKINSPGGTVTASDIIYKEILSFKHSRNIPVHALFMDTAASGAFYIAMASDKITAHPTTVTGSIGVVMMGLNFSEAMTKLGIKSQTIASGKNKTIGSPFEAPTEERTAILQSVVNDLFERFFDVVHKGRKNIPEDKLRKLADGRIYTASQAKTSGLVDNIGYFRDSVIHLRNDPKYRGTAGQNPKIITYTYSSKNVNSVYNLQKAKSDFGFPLQLPPSGFLYLWDGN